ncbi:MAG TPA: aldo/keto reductase [Candidatus Saccharimonadales bacterium]|nr:aldo/keto reductase [Candidatus Saccharimonadales bacterium]
MAEVSAAAAGTVKLGDITINRLGLGTNRISDNDQSRTILRHAIARGINFIDTADKYGASEEIIGQTLAPYPKSAVIATKGGWSQDNSPRSLEDKINNSLRLLKLDRLPLWQLHRMDPSVPIEQTMEFLKTQQAAGKIQHIGLSEVSIEQIEAARQIVPIVSVQNHYNLEMRQHEDVVDYCTQNGVVFMPFFPLSSGGSSNDSKLQAVAKKYRATPIQIAIAWLLKRSPIMLPIPGTLSPEHLDENIAAAAIELSDEDFSSL